MRFAVVYIESCAMFVRGGVYRIVKEAMGGKLALLAVSALLFDYILTGPISARDGRTVHRRTCSTSYWAWDPAAL